MGAMMQEGRNLRATSAVAIAICWILAAPLGAQDGALDLSFEGDGIATVAFDLGGDTYNVAYDMLIQPDGKIVLAGFATGDGAYSSVVARLNSNGTPDSSFSGDGKAEFANGLGSQGFQAVALQDGKIIVAGYFTAGAGQDYDFIVARLHTNGTLDASFGAAGMRTVFFDLGPDKTDRLDDMMVQADGKIVLVGSVQTSLNATDSSYDMGVARLTADGDLDTTFSGDGKMIAAFDAGGLKHDQPRGVAQQPDGKIVVAGTVDVGDTDTDLAVIRINSNGGLDSSFGAGGSGGIIVPFNLGGSTHYDQAWDVAVQGRKIVAVGQVEMAVGGSDMAAIRLNSNGTLDPTFSDDGKQVVSFDVGGFLYDEVYGVALHGDGKIVMAGISTIGTTDRDFALARLRLDGELDSTFDGDGRKTVPIDLGPDWIDGAEALGIQRDGKIVIAGYAYTAPSSSDMAVARLHSTHVLFADGFETGDTEIWSAGTP